MKKFLTFTKFLWIGGIMGFIQQWLGRLDFLLYHGSNEIFRFSAIMGDFSIYAGIILLVINRKMPPKKQFTDILLYFVGLDFFYYLYIFIIELIPFLSKEYSFDPSYHYFQRTLTEVYDFIYWTSIGLAAAFWAFFATKLRDSGKRKLYDVMLLPLFAVILFELVAYSFGIVLFAIQQYNITHNNLTLGNGDIRHASTIAEALTALVMLVICLYKYFKKPAAQKAVTQS